jgi:hypothetical protein
MIDGAGAQGITKGSLRAFREIEMLRHQGVDLSLNRVAGPTLERELGQVSICQYCRREWESRNDRCIESKEPACRRYRGKHGYRPDPGGIQPGSQCVSLQNACDGRYITGVERNTLAIVSGGQGGCFELSGQIRPHNPVPSHGRHRPEHRPKRLSLKIPAGSKCISMLMQMGMSLGWKAGKRMPQGIVGPEQAHLGTTAKRPDVTSPKSPTEELRLYIRRGIEKHLIQPSFYPQMTCDVFSEVRLLLFQLD